MAFRRCGLTFATKLWGLGLTKDSAEADDGTQGSKVTAAAIMEEKCLSSLTWDKKDKLLPMLLFRYRKSLCVIC